jgi:hypothetical protein
LKLASLTKNAPIPYGHYVRPCASGARLQDVRIQMICQSVSHLTTTRVPGAKEENPFMSLRSSDAPHTLISICTKRRSY